jgi:ribosomal protein L40E
MPYQYEKLIRRRLVAQEYVASVRAETICERCGSQPVEWHNESHAAKLYFRVSTLCILGRSIERIQQEIDTCEAFCRSCHMAIDGRAAALVAARPFKKGDRQPPRPCSECGAETNPQWHGRCRRCYDAMRRPKTKTCACGCGASIATGSTWARGHQERRAS